MVIVVVLLLVASTTTTITTTTTTTTTPPSPPPLLLGLMGPRLPRRACATRGRLTDLLATRRDGERCGDPRPPCARGATRLELTPTLPPNPTPAPALTLTQALTKERRRWGHNRNPKLSPSPDPDPNPRQERRRWGWLREERHLACVWRLAERVARAAAIDQMRWKAPRYLVTTPHADWRVMTTPSTPRRARTQPAALRVRSLQPRVRSLQYPRVSGSTSSWPRATPKAAWSTRTASRRVRTPGRTGCASRGSSCYSATYCLPLATRYVALLWAEGHERGLYEPFGNESSTQAHLQTAADLPPST